MAITRQAKKEELARNPTARPIQRDGASASASAGKKRGKPRENAVNPIPPNNVVDATEIAQPVASTSQLPMAEVPSKTSTRARKTKDPMATDLWTQPLSSTSVLPLIKGSVKGKERMRQEDVDDLMRSTIGTEATEMTNIEFYLPTSASVLADNGSVSQGKGKKRARPEKDSTEVKPSKRVKIANTSAETIKTVKIKKAITAPTRKSGKRSIIVQSVKWKVVEPALLDPSTSVEPSSVKKTDLRPRIWTNSRKELLAMMPEMAGPKCFNGISWEMYETPTLLLDEINTCFQVERDDTNPLCLDLITTRSFVCPIPYESDIQKSSVIDIPPPPQPFEAPATSSEQPSGVRARPRYKLKLPPNKNEMPPQPIAPPEPEVQGLETVVQAKALPTLTFHIKEPVVAESLSYSSSSLVNNLEVANGSVVTRPAESSSSHIIKFDPMSIFPGSPSAHPGVDFTKFVDMAFNIASDIANQIQHSPFPSPGSDLGHYGYHNTSTPMTLAAEVSTQNHVAQAEKLPAGRRPFQSIPIIPSSVEGKSYTLGGIHNEDKQLSSPVTDFSEDERKLPPFEHSISIRAAEAHLHSRSMEHGAYLSNVPTLTWNPYYAPSASASIGMQSYGDLAAQQSRQIFQPPPLVGPYIGGGGGPYIGNAASSSQHFSVMMEDSDEMQLVDPEESLENLGVKTDTHLRWPLEDKRNSLYGFLPPHQRPISTSTTLAPANTLTTDTGFASQHISVMMGENSDTIKLEGLEEPLERPLLGTDDRLHDYVPSPIPEELDALADSYLFGRPLTILISNGLLEKYWSLKLPSNYGYSMLGYFKILGIQETRVSADDETNKSTKNAQAQDSLAGQVRWQFRLQWAPGGEEGILAEGNTFDLKRPWWDPSPPLEETSKEQATELVVDKVLDGSDDPESSFPTTPRYRDARLRHHEYKFRHLPLDDLYQSLVPLHLLIPFGQDYMDTSFPRGWFCKDCGRLNFQAALRHRKCLSSLCKDKPPPVDSYAQILFFLRDPQERLPLSAPLNQYPERLVTTAITRFPDGMQTFSYCLSKNPNIMMKHIFTSNSPPLQEPATGLLHDIQINVPIVRPLTENTPYFFWLAKSPKENTKPTDTEWENILPTMNQAKNLIVSTVRSFGGLKEDLVAVNHLRMLAWITAGSKRGPDIIRAKNKPVIFFAMGCTVVLVVTPRSMGGTTMVDKSHEAESSKLPKSEIVDFDATSGWIAENDEDGGGAEEPIEIPKKGKAIAKSTKSSFVITLMHGDMIVFYGDEFEYSVKRDGTSLLLIASHDSFEHA